MIETPFLTVDGIVCLEDGRVVLIERKSPPLGRALPGGFVDRGETIQDALVREMREEISLAVTIRHLQGVYSAPGRDARFHTVSCVFVCDAVGHPVAADDAKAVHILTPSELGRVSFVFDHARIIDDFLAGRRGIY